MDDTKIVELEEVLFGVPLDVMERHFFPDGETKVPPGSRGYPCLLREDIKTAAIERCGVPPEVVEAWGPIGIEDALAAAERLNNRARTRRDLDGNAR